MRPPALRPSNAEALVAWMAEGGVGTAMGRPRNPLDMIVAAIAEVNDCVVVADNENDFAGVGWWITTE
jgi:predicted nucleic acid-binding protein